MTDFVVLKLDEPITAQLNLAVELLKSNRAIAFPTETVYGLGANALSPTAVLEIFKAKGRPSDNPLIVHISSIEMLEKMIAPKRIPVIYEEVIKKYWPGPLTILLDKPDCIPDIVTAGQSSVAVRMPAHPIARALIEACGFPLAAPSANTSGRPSPTLAQHVMDDLNGKIPLILDGGYCQSGLESTVLDGLRPVPAILRPGGVTVEMLEGLIGHINVYKRDFVDSQLENAPTTPGMKYRHYSPNAKVILVEVCDNVELQLLKIEEEYKEMGDQKVGVLLACDTLNTSYPLQLALGSTNVQVAQSLFVKLREMEAMQVETIIVQGVSEQDEGMAVMNRLRKASSKII